MLDASQIAQMRVWYRPIDIAIRWCRMLSYEHQILRIEWQDLKQLRQFTPHGESLAATMELLMEAIRCGELAYGVLGQPTPPGCPVEPSLLTVRHSDLLVWLNTYHSDKQPEFLFSKVSDDTGMVALGIYLSMKADRDEWQRAYRKLNIRYKKLVEELAALGVAQDQLEQLVSDNDTLNVRSARGYARVIGALSQLFFKRSPSGKQLSVFENQEMLIEGIQAHFPNCPGLSSRSLSQKLAEGNRAIKEVVDS